MQQKPRHRLTIDAALRKGAEVVLEGNQAHYLTTVLRLGVGGKLGLFNREDGEWLASITDIMKKKLTVTVEEQTRLPARGINLIICFAPIKGGRLETIIEKATELGASVLQPVLTNRTIVDKVNLERAEAIAREAAEQCERVDWPEIRSPMKLEKLLGDWPADVPLIYGDESGDSASINELLRSPRVAEGEPRSSVTPPSWAILIGPEGGFTPEEFAMLTRVKAAKGVGLGPRILRADTAVITLAALTLAAWGDWDQAPRFNSGA